MAIAKSKRVLIVVSYLSDSVDWFNGYNFIESSGLATVNALLGDKYSRIEVLSNSNATKQKFLDKLQIVGSRSTVLAIDVLIFTHGTRKSLIFYKTEGDHNHKVTIETFKKEISDLNISSKLRLLYSTACFGSSHNQGFIEAGFKTAIGAIGVNTNSGIELPIALSMWGLGNKISTAISAGETGYEATDTIASFFNSDWNEANSEKDIDGRAGIKITSNP